MFPANRPHRQILATVLVAGISVAPLALSLITAWRLTRPGHVRDVEVELSSLLGARVTVGRVIHPRPGEDVFEEIAISQEAGEDPADSHARLHAKRLRTRIESRNLGLEFDELRIQGSRSEQVLAFVEAASQSLLRRLDRISLSAPSLALDLSHGRPGSPKLALFDVAVVMLKQSGAPGISASFRLASSEFTGRYELTLQRETSPAGLRTCLHLQTFDQPLPVALLDPVAPLAEWVGERAGLMGDLTLTRDETTGAWSAQFEGRLLNVELACLVSKHFEGNNLAGCVTIEFERARWGELPRNQGRGWVEAAGRIVGGRGSIGSPMVGALAAELGFRKQNSGDPAQESLAFQAIGLAFVLTPEGELRISGGLGPDLDSNAILVCDDRQRTMLSAPAGAVNVRGLWNALFTDRDDVLVPVTSNSHVMRFLPLPPELPKSGSRGRAN